MNYIVFERSSGGQTFRYISPPTRTDPFYIRKYLIDNGGISLYVDRLKPSKYFFDFPFPVLPV